MEGPITVEDFIGVRIIHITPITEAANCDYDHNCASSATNVNYNETQ